MYTAEDEFSRKTTLVDTLSLGDSYANIFQSVHMSIEDHYPSQAELFIPMNVGSSPLSLSFYQQIVAEVKLLIEQPV